MTALYGYLIGAGAVFVAFVVTYMRGRHAGASIERHKQDATEAKARDISGQVDNDVGALPGGVARKELGKWGR